jgi:hypothetical protein
MQNANFLYVAEYEQYIPLNKILKLCGTQHLSGERLERYNYAKDNSEEIDKVFLVDKGHPAGMELHCVAKNGVIWILNERKFLNGEPSLVTILFGRPNQVKRLYEDCGLFVERHILDCCYANIMTNRNNM